MEHGVVASAGPGCLVRRCQQCGGLGVGEVADLVAGPAFRWDRQDAADGGQVFRVKVGGLSAVDDYPQWTGRRIRIPLQGRRLAL